MPAFRIRSAALLAAIAFATIPALARVALHDLPMPDPAPRAKLDLTNEPVDTTTEPSIAFSEAEIVRSIVEVAATDPAAALKTLVAAETPESSAMYDFIIGNLNFQLDRRDDALKYYELAVRKAPNFAKAHKNLGYLALQSERLDEALKAFLKTVQLGNAEGGVYGLLGYIYISKENFLAAESAYREAMLKMPDNVDWKLGIGRADLAHQKNADVMNIMAELLARDAGKRDYWLVHANALLSQNRVMDAATDYEIMARMGIGTKDTFQMLGNIYTSQNMAPLALIAYKEALSLEDPPTIESMLGAAEVLGARGAISESGELTDGIKAVYKNVGRKEQIRLLKLQSELAIARDDKPAAEGFLQELVNLDEADGQTMLLLADFYGRAGKYDQATPLYEKAAKLDGFAVDAWVKHAQMLVAQGKYEDAIPLLEHAVEKLGQEENFTRRDNVARYLESVRRINRSSRF